MSLRTTIGHRLPRIRQMPMPRPRPQVKPEKGHDGMLILNDITAHQIQKVTRWKPGKGGKKNVLEAKQRMKDKNKQGETQVQRKQREQVQRQKGHV